MSNDYVTKDYLDKKIDDLAKLIGNNVNRAITESFKLVDEKIDNLKRELRKDQAQNTEKILTTLKSYEKKTEKHDEIFRNIKKEMDD